MTTVTWPIIIEIPAKFRVTCTEEFVATDTLTENDEEFITINTFATKGEKFAATTALADSESHVNVELAATKRSKILTN